MSMRELSVQAERSAARPGPSLVAPRRARAAAAALLRAASRALDSLAGRLARVPAATPGDAMLEFHAEAGAPEGALYIDGRLVGHLVGVNRL